MRCHPVGGGDRSHQGWGFAWIAARLSRTKNYFNLQLGTNRPIENRARSSLASQCLGFGIRCVLESVIWLAYVQAQQGLGASGSRGVPKGSVPRMVYTSLGHRLVRDWWSVIGDWRLAHRAFAVGVGQATHLCPCIGHMADVVFTTSPLPPLAQASPEKNTGPSHRKNMK